jgi:hypothetical protein
MTESRSDLISGSRVLDTRNRTRGRSLNPLSARQSCASLLKAGSNLNLLATKDFTDESVSPLAIVLRPFHECIAVPHV